MCASATYIQGDNYCVFPSIIAVLFVLFIFIVRSMSY